MKTKTRPNENGFPKPKKAECFKCQKQFWIKFVVPQRDYSKKNNWEYWTNPQATNPDFWKDQAARQKDQQICDACLYKFYYNKEVYWATITDLKKRQQIRKYIYDGTIVA